MYADVKNTITECQILIISDDSERAYQLTEHANWAAFHALSTTSFAEARHYLEHFQPEIIIAFDEKNSVVRFFQEFISAVTSVQRPSLIAVSDDPSMDLFALADQVIPTSYIAHLGQIVSKSLEGTRKAVLQESRSADLSARNGQLNKELAVANQISAEVSLLKQAIVHSVSHELRTPMLQVKSAVALLHEDETTNRTIVELAMEATTRLESGIRNVTLLNELMNEKSDVESFTTVPFIHIIQAAVRNLGRSWEHKKAVGRVMISPINNDCLVLCDKQRLTMAIQLLLDNALKFSKDTVTVEMVRSSNNVTVNIQDKGIGIAPEQIEHIVEPFYQIDGSSTRRFGGMGIGLAIVQLILEQHGTMLQIESTEGQGSTFGFGLNEEHP